MKTNITAGKWKVMNGHEGGNEVAYIRCNEATIATCYRINVSDEEGKANAILISKAPELFQAVVNLQKRLQTLINATTSAANKNSLTDENILTLQLINECCGVCMPAEGDDLTPSVAFAPDEELLKFAKQFSINYKILHVGEYFSDNKKYHIKYCERIINRFGKPLNTGGRIGDKSGIIELDKTLFKDKAYTSDWVFFIILWCVTCNDQENKGDMKTADKMAVEYYLTTRRSKKNLLAGFMKLFSGSANKILNKERYRLIAQMLEAKNKTQQIKTGRITK